MIFKLVFTFKTKLFWKVLLLEKVQLQNQLKATFAKAVLIIDYFIEFEIEKEKEIERKKCGKLLGDEHCMRPEAFFLHLSSLPICFFVHNFVFSLLSVCFFFYLFLCRSVLFVLTSVSAKWTNCNSFVFCKYQFLYESVFLCFSVFHCKYSFESKCQFIFLHLPKF